MSPGDLKASDKRRARASGLWLALGAGLLSAGCTMPIAGIYVASQAAQQAAATPRSTRAEPGELPPATPADRTLAASGQARSTTAFEQGVNDPRGNTSARSTHMNQAMDHAVAAVASAAAAMQPAPGNTPGGAPGGTPGTTSAGAAPADATPGVRPLGLYGQLPNPKRENASPLDSPDNLRRVTFASEGADFDPALDPTGQLIVYASTQHRQTSDLYIKKVDGTAVTQLTNDPANDVMPVFSPDGKKIAFASDRSGNWDIYLMDVDGGPVVQLTNDVTQDIHPSFSPDGKQLVYCTYGTQSGQWELVLLNVENPANKRFIGYGLFPSWSPAENKILFQRARERGTRWFSVWTLDIVNGEGVRPTEIAASTNAAVITPAWSPDGKRVVFSTVLDPLNDDHAKPQQADLWVINADGTNRVSLTRGSAANLQPTWSRDGTIYFVSNRSREGSENIYSIRPDRAVSVARNDRATPPPAATVNTVAPAPPPAPGNATAESKAEPSPLPWPVETTTATAATPKPAPAKVPTLIQATPPPADTSKKPAAPAKDANDDHAAEPATEEPTVLVPTDP